MTQKKTSPQPGERTSADRTPPRAPAPWWRRKAAVVTSVLVVAGAAAAAIVLTVAGGGGSSSASPAANGPQGPEGIPLETGALLAPASTTAHGQPVDGISCSANEQVAYHVHTHLSVYVDGQLRPIPAGVGIVSPVPTPTAHGTFVGASRCYYWLHVHVQDGVIHIESPTSRTYTLGQFFDIWRQPLSSTQVAGVSGHLTVFVDGHRYTGNVRNVALGSHQDVQIDVGTPVVAPRAVNWKGTGL